MTSQHIEYLIEGIRDFHSFNLEGSVKDTSLATLKKAVPKIIEALDGELHRLNFRNLVNIVEAFHSLYEGQAEDGRRVLSEA
jgi:hypothetical protein